MPRPAARRPPVAKPRKTPPRGAISVASLVALVLFTASYAAAVILRGIPLWTDALYFGASALCFALYGFDKQAAIQGRERIAESTLLSVGFIGGWPGAIVAQEVFRHKTSKRSFRVRFWLLVIANAALFVWAVTLR